MAVKVKKEVQENSSLKVKDETKKEGKKKDRTKKSSKSGKVTKVKKESSIRNWFRGVRSEFKKVRWPNKKEMIKYSIATISFILFFALFFYVIEVIIYFIKQAV